MSTFNPRDIERAIQNTQLVSVSDLLLPRINTQSIAVLYAGQAIEDRKAGYRLATEAEQPFPKTRELYSGHDQAKHFPPALTEGLNDFNIPTSISPFVIYCCKTGQPVGSIDNDALYMAIDLHGVSSAAELLYHGNLNVPHPAWRKTALQTREQYNVILDKLCDLQPQAYAAYCMGLIAQRYHRIRQSAKWQSPQVHAEFHWSLARAYQILGLVPKSDLPEICDALCHVLTYPDSVRYLNRLIGNRIKSPDTLAKLALSKDLHGLLNKALDATFQGMNNWSGAIERAAYEDAAKVSQIRAQRMSKVHRVNNELRLKKLTKKKEREEEVNKLADLFGSYLGEAKEIPGQEKWRNRFERAEGIAKPANYEPSNLASPDIEEAFGEATDLESLMDDQPEIRTTTWAALAELHAEKLAIAEKQKLEAEAKLAETAPVMSATSRFARIAKPIVPAPLPEIPKTSNLPSRFQRNKKG